MFRFKLVAAFLILLVATACLWQFRFARHPDFPTLTLADLKSSAPLVPGATWSGTADHPELLLQVTAPAQAVIQRLPLPNLPPTRWLHLRCRIQATHLAVGPSPWSDGRLILEWRTDGDSVEFDSVDSARGDRDSGVLTVIARPARSAATPTLRLEHLGVSGAFRVLTFEATVVEERKLWKVGKWLFGAAWGAWFAAAAGFARRPTRLRPFLAGIIWLVMAVTFSFPGPWKTLHPLTTSFQLGPELRQPSTTLPTPTPAPAAQPTLAQPPPAISAGKIPTQGGVLVKVKAFINEHCAVLKPLYHIPLLFAPTLLSLLLITRRRALALAAFTALAIEATQLAFGNYPDWFDALDLLCDVLGILLAWRIWRWLQQRGVPTCPPNLSRRSLRPQ